MRVTFLLIAYLVFTIASAQQVYYVQNPAYNSKASDNNPGTDINLPWATWQHAFENANAGDTVYFRGGVWKPTKYAVSANITYINPDAGFGHNGTSDNPICFFNYPGESPELDCSLIVPITKDNTGIHVFNATYLKFKGLTISNVLQVNSGVNVNAIELWTGGNYYLENMVAHDNQGAGFFMTGYDTLSVVNCDSYNNYDPLTNVPGNHADGFFALDGGNYGDPQYYHKYSHIEGCRAWNNSDDGFNFNFFKRSESFNNWSFSNGHQLANLEGNGFKWGHSHLANTDNRIIHHNLSAFNKGAGHLDAELTYNVIGSFYNNTVYHCDAAFLYSSMNPLPDEVQIIHRNNLAYENNGALLFGTGDARTNYDGQYNSFQWSDAFPYYEDNPKYKIDDTDFLLTDSVAAITQLTAPRKPDGSLPDITFMHLASGSELIDSGTVVGLSYVGSAPDIGAFEYGEISNAYPIIEITSPTSGSTYSENDNITIVASASDPDRTVDKVEFFNGINSKIGEVVSAPWTYTWTNAPAGEFQIWAVATDNQNASTSSKKIDINVTVPRTLEIIGYSPNPTTGNVTVVYYCPQTTFVNISVENNAGTQVLSTDHNAISGENNQVNIDLSSLQAGNYTITLNDGVSSVSCEVTKEDPRQLEISSYSPNPTTGAVTVVYYSPAESVITIKVFNSVGSQVQSFTNNAYSGENNTVDIDLTGLAAGIYTIQISNNNTNDTCYVTLQDNAPVRTLEIISSTTSTYDFCTVTFYCPDATSVSIEVFNTSGQVVLNQSHNSSTGNNTVDINLSDLPQGEYRITLYDGATSDECNVTKEVNEEPIDFAIINGSPNPTVDLFIIDFTSPVEMTASISVFDESNKEVLNETYAAKRGNNKVVLNLSSLPTGNYTVVINNGQTDINTTVSKQEFYQ